MSARLRLSPQRRRIGVVCAPSRAGENRGAAARPTSPLLEFYANPVRAAPHNMAAARRILAVEHQIKVVRDSERTFHHEAGPGFRQIARRAIDLRSEMME